MLDTSTPSAELQAPQTLLTARWAVLAALTVISIGQWLYPSLLGRQLGGPWLASILILAGAGVNWIASRRRQRWSARRAGLQLLGDVAGITAFLALAGGAANPFTMLYFVPIGLATLLPRGFTWLVAAASLLGFGALLLLTMQNADLAGHFLHHLVGMWFGLAISGATITLFVHRLSAALARQRSELEQTRQSAREARNLATLGGLAAGAAHELGSPLGTIQLLLDDLEQLPAGQRSEALENVQKQLRRCKQIVHNMANPELSAEQLAQIEPWLLSSLELGEGAVPTTSAYGQPISVRISATPNAKCLIHQPRLVVQRVVEELVRNAVDAAPDGTSSEIDITLDAADGVAQIAVQDTGPGVPPELQSSAFEPFVSTKATGRGLGLFLSRSHLGQLGGSLKFEPVTPHGARFLISLPVKGPIPDRSSGFAT